jgi:hypothetical protein
MHCHRVSSNVRALCPRVSDACVRSFMAVIQSNYDSGDGGCLLLPPDTSSVEIGNMLFRNCSSTFVSAFTRPAIRFAIVRNPALSFCPLSLALSRCRCQMPGFVKNSRALFLTLTRTRARPVRIRAPASLAMAEASGWGNA